MQIIYNQSAAESFGGKTLEALGVKRCYLKHITISHKNDDFTKKAHHHTGFEAHAVMRGEQKYELCGETITVGAGDILIIPPMLRHRVVSASVDTEKTSICFDKDDCDGISYVFARIPKSLTAALELAKEEYYSPLCYSQTRIEAATITAVCDVLRLSGVKSAAPPRSRSENATFTLARRYIEDNIKADLSTSDVADYCYLSAKQLTRIFEKETGLPLGAYIRRERCEKIRELLEGGELTLSEISETMNFKNEYYFNAFFKKNAGIAPGAYSKTVNRR